MPELEWVEQGLAEVVAFEGDKCLHPAAALPAADVCLEPDVPGWQLRLNNQVAAHIGCVVHQNARQMVVQQLAQWHIALVLLAVAGLLEDALIEEDLVAGRLPVNPTLKATK